MPFSVSLIILTVLLAILVLVLALALLRQSGAATRDSRQAGDPAGTAAKSLTFTRSRLLEHERESDLLRDLAGQFASDFDLEFAEFTLADPAEEPADVEAAPSERRRAMTLGTDISGAFHWKERSGSNLSEEQLKGVETTAWVYLDNLRRLKQYKSLSIRDPLTGLYNAAYLRDRLGKEVGRARRSKRSLGLMIIDLDNFKKINDLHGHMMGDKILKSLSELLTGNVRAADVVARYGGDEICVILPESDSEQTGVFMRRLHRTVSRFAAGQRPVQATISIGAAVLPGQNADADELFKAADDALLQAKRQGRNRAVLAGSPALQSKEV
ncbi:MAG: GGDEF domain-containing protein [Candidatus Zixiibacteriota bacterium]